MDRLGRRAQTRRMTLTDTALAALTRRTLATLATTSAAGRPHAANVLYAAVPDVGGVPHLYVSTDLSSRKARNVAANPHVGVTVLVRRLPVGTPSAVQFQGTAEILDLDDPALRELAAAGRIDAVTGHGELGRPGGCFLRIRPGRRLHTYGLGMSLWTLIRNPLDAAGVVELPAA